MNKKKSYFKIISIITLCVLLLTTFIFLYLNYSKEKNDNATLTQAEKNYQNLFNKDKTPKENITLTDTKNIKKSLDNIKNNLNKKAKLVTKLENLEDYLILKDEVLTYYNAKIMLSTTTIKDIKSLESKNENLKEPYQGYINIYLTDLKTQQENINMAITKVNNLFTDGVKNDLKNETTRENIEEAKKVLDSLPQKDIQEKLTPDIEKAIKIITKREEEEKRRLEEERKKQEEERKRQEERRKKQEEERIRQEQIQNAWIKLNVPYISQNKNGVYNGCEVAALLMALQYKNYLLDMDLVTYATMVPKSTDPEEGFIYDIFGLDPRDVPHWIAPEPLAKFGRDSAGYENVINTTNLSIDELDHELENNNPVIIYLTSKFEEPKNWNGAAPLNIHILLLTGYNKITNEHLLIDPWTYNDGRTNWTISKEKLEKIYNAVGKKSVTIR